MSETTVLGSADGRAWTVRSRIGKPGESFVADMTAFGDRLVAVGYSGNAFPLRPRAWISDDRGRTWRTGGVEGTDARMADVAVEANVLIGHGIAPSLDGSSASWTSPDGSAWTRLPADVDTPAVSGFASSAPAWSGPTACVAGTFETPGAPRGVIYCTTRPATQRG